MAHTVLGNLEDIPAIKTEFEEIFEAEEAVISKEYTSTTNVYDDSNCANILFFTQREIDNTRRCLDNTRLILQDIEIQLDWHLQQYMKSRNLAPVRYRKSAEDYFKKRQDLLSISQLRMILSLYPEGNKNFIKRKDIVNGFRNKKRKSSSGESDQIKKVLKTEIKTEDKDFLEDNVEVKNEYLDHDETSLMLRSKAISSLADLCGDSDKAIVFLTENNVHNFDFNAFKLDNVVVTFQDLDNLPKFVFAKDVADGILDGSIKLVDAKVFIKHEANEGLDF